MTSGRAWRRAPKPVGALRGAKSCAFRKTLVLALSAFLCAGPQARAASQDDLVKRGEYLARAGDCISCHTATSHGGTTTGISFAGGLAISTPFGYLVSPNITPDDETGIGTWTADDFWRAIHFGINKRGEPLYPAMPYVFFTRATREDSDAIFAFLKSLKPVRHAVDVNHLDWPYDMRFAAMTAWQTMWFTPGVYQPDPSKPAAWNRGAYLVEGLGHCGACHTPRNFMGAVEPSERFTGAGSDAGSPRTSRRTSARDRPVFARRARPVLQERRDDAHRRGNSADNALGRQTRPSTCRPPSGRWRRSGTTACAS